MRKTWLRVFLLCMACLICMGGLCAAKSKDELTFMWEDENKEYKYYIDDNATKMIDVDGRKYLQTYIQISTLRDIEIVHFTLIFDVENRKVFGQESKIKNRKEITQDISMLKHKLIPLDPQLFGPMFQWIESNRKPILEEIRKANGEAPSVQEQSGTQSVVPDKQQEVPANIAPDIPSRTYSPVDYQTGALAFCPLGWRFAEDDVGWAEIYLNPYREGGEYTILTGNTEKDGRHYDRYHEAFDYDEETGYFTFTGGFYRNGDLTEYVLRAKVLDREEPAIYVEWLQGNRQSPPALSANPPYPNGTYTLRYITQANIGNAFVPNLNNEPYRFASDEGGVIDHDISASVSAMFAFLDFIDNGGEISEPPHSMKLPDSSLLKHPEWYRGEEQIWILSD